MANIEEKSELTQAPIYSLPVESSRYQEDEIDFVGFILDLKTKWKMILGVIIIGCVLSVGVALSLPRVYQASVKVSLPTTAAVAKLAENGMKQYSLTELLQVFYNKVRSQSFLREFVINNGYLEKLYPDDYDKKIEDRIFNVFAAEFRITIDEPQVAPGEFVDQPTLFSISIQHENEALIVELINHYLEHTNRVLLQKMIEDQKIQRDLQLVNLERRADLLRENEKTVKRLTISKMEAENDKKLNILEQKRALLITKAANDRKTQIEIMEEGNKQKLNQLLQQKQLLKEKFAADRQSDIVLAQEALKMAESLNIVYPTKLDDFNKRSTGAADGTNITLSDNQSLPLYLMGTKYLESLIKTLQERKNEALFIKQINEIDAEIAKVKDDQVLKTLKERQSDAPFLAELNQIEREIAQIKNDQQLRALKERTFDDPFISGLPPILNDIVRLKVLSFDFEGVQSYSLDKAAILTNKPVKPNRKFIAVFGGFISCLVALLLAIFSIAKGKWEVRRAQLKNVERIDAQPN